MTQFALTDAATIVTSAGPLFSAHTVGLEISLGFGIFIERRGVLYGGNDMPGDPKECREHAKNIAMADAAVSPMAKARFEDLARTWTRLANDLEHAKALVEHWGHPKIKSGCVQPERAVEDLVSGMAAKVPKAS